MRTSNNTASEIFYFFSTPEFGDPLKGGSGLGIANVCSASVIGATPVAGTTFIPIPANKSYAFDLGIGSPGTQAPLTPDPRPVSIVFMQLIKP